MIVRFVSLIKARTRSQTLLRLAKVTLFPKKRLTILETVRNMHTTKSIDGQLALQGYKSALKHCSFLNLANIALTVSCEHWVECPSNWDIQ